MIVEGCPDRMYFSIGSFFSFLFTALCKRCKEHLANLMADFFVEKNPDLYGVGEALPSEAKGSPDESEQEVEEVVGERLKDHYLI